MNRVDWLKEKRRLAVERYDNLWAPIYDENWGGIDPVHQRFVTQLADACPMDGSILDAACGTGKYWPFLLASGRKFTGIDQSQKMLDYANSKFPQVTVEKLGLQELSYRGAFDLILCMDAMENVFPEEWPTVLANFHRALKPLGQLYFTVELLDREQLDHDHQAGLEQGLPVVYGESAVGTADLGYAAGYHYYPPMDQVRQWLDAAGFQIKEQQEANFYHHFWVEKSE